MIVSANSTLLEARSRAPATSAIASSSPGNASSTSITPADHVVHDAAEVAGDRAEQRAD